MTTLLCDGASSGPNGGSPAPCLVAPADPPSPVVRPRGRGSLNQHSKQQQRIKLSRELMLRLSAALSSSSSAAAAATTTTAAPGAAASRSAAAPNNGQVSNSAPITTSDNHVNIIAVEQPAASKTAARLSDEDASLDNDNEADDAGDLGDSSWSAAGFSTAPGQSSWNFECKRPRESSWLVGAACHGPASARLFSAGADDDWPVAAAERISRKPPTNRRTQTTTTTSVAVWQKVSRSRCCCRGASRSRQPKPQRLWLPAHRRHDQRHGPRQTPKRRARHRHQRAASADGSAVGVTSGRRGRSGGPLASGGGGGSTCGHNSNCRSMLAPANLRAEPESHLSKSKLLLTEQEARSRTAEAAKVAAEAREFSKTAAAVARVKVVKANRWRQRIDCCDQSGRLAIDDDSRRAVGVATIERGDAAVQAAAANKDDSQSHLIDGLAAAGDSPSGTFSAGLAGAATGQPPPERVSSSKTKLDDDDEAENGRINFIRLEANHHQHATFTCNQLRPNRNNNNTINSNSNRNSNRNSNSNSKSNNEHKPHESSVIVSSSSRLSSLSLPKSSLRPLKRVKRQRQQQHQGQSSKLFFPQKTNNKPETAIATVSNSSSSSSTRGSRSKRNRNDNDRIEGRRKLKPKTATTKTCESPERGVARPKRRVGSSASPTGGRRGPTGTSGLLWLLVCLLFVCCCRCISSSGLATTRSADQSVDIDANGGGGSTSDELNRAVLATMSTQSPPSGSSFGGGGGGSSSSNDYSNYSTSFGNGLDSSTTLQSLGADPNAAAIGSGEKSILDRVLDFGRIFIMSAIIVGDICGNSLVILSVCRHTKLRVTTNWFVVSLACADILVALFAMTFNASVIISGRWLFKRWVCDFWNSCDVLASTASILHLCCISIDRYIAIMRPLDYPMKITTRRVMYALCGVWISSALLSYIPIFTGIYTTAEHIEWLRENPDQCDFVVNRVYAIVSSSISFWIPCCIMVFTYYRIYREATRQEKFIYNAQKIMPAPQPNHHHHHHSSNSSGAKSGHNAAAHKRRSKSMAAPAAAAGADQQARIRHLAKQQLEQQKLQAAGAVSKPMVATTELNAASSLAIATADRAGSLQQLPLESQPLNTTPAGQTTATDLNNNNNNENGAGTGNATVANKTPGGVAFEKSAAAAAADDDDEDDGPEEETNSGQSTPTKRSISKMKREHKAAKTLGIIMGVFILCWLPFFSWYTPQHICGHACDGMVPGWAVTILFWIGYFNSTLNPIIYAYFNHEFRDAFKKTLQWIFCCCQDLKCLRVNRPNDNQHYNCTYRSTQEIGLVSNG